MKSVLAALLLICLPCPAEQPGAVFLMIFPDARTMGLGGCGTAGRDLGANCYYNTAGLGFGAKASATWGHANWLPGLYPEMSFEYAGAAYRVNSQLGAGLNVTYLQTGKTDVINEHGRYLGSYRTWDMAIQAGAAYRPLRWLSAGIGLKGIYSMLVPEWVWDSMPELGIEHGGSAFTVATDLGLQLRPLDWLGIGAALQNFGPDINYLTGPTDPLPALLRFGWEVAPPIPGPVEVRLVSDVWRDLVTDMHLGNLTGKERLLAFSEELEFGAGLELRFAKVASVRLGYFEDIQGQRGGVLVVPPVGNWPRRIGWLRYLSERRDYGKPLSWGFCWGCGVEYEGFAFDVGVDENIYDFATRNVRFQLSWQMR